MAQKVRVEYGRKVTDNFDSKTISGAIEVDLLDGEHWQEVYDGIYAALKTKVDGLAGKSDAPLQSQQHRNPVAPVQQPAFQPMPGENIQQRPAMEEGQVYQHPAPSNQSGGTVFEIQENAPYAFTNCKVFKKEIGTNRWGKYEGSLRIGNREQIPGDYVTAKTNEAPLIAKMQGIEEQQFVDVKGYFKAWKGNENRPEPKFDFIVQEITKTGAQSYATAASGPQL